jgi:plasmid stabilization system protein ParE
MQSLYNKNELVAIFQYGFLYGRMIAFAPAAEDDLAELYEYIPEHGSPAIAARYTGPIVAHCKSLATTFALGCGSRTTTNTSL